ncbi:YggT family protein [Sulfurimonas sp.]|jgi:YggT family protein|uniref:YggT family protein n=1 Tax=Sulfurimonas sp. TaxID=2022749 RepID=UPI0025D06431|nr:YggT family protein [Sulfurimonas sp.]MCK9472425.1 YggT family protein [Sulfurimonas sp.]MDD3505866.1 YggT family protein [Sulfurimonas sp.]
MSILIEIIQGIGAIALTLINIYMWVVIIAALLSFVNPDPFNPIVQFLYRITNPAYSLVKRYIRTNFNGLDLAPLIIIIGLQIISVLLSAVLRAL